MNIKITGRKKFLGAQLLIRVAPEYSLDDGVGRQLKVWQHISLHPRPISLVYNTAELTGVNA